MGQAWGQGQDGEEAEPSSRLSVAPRLACLEPHISRVITVALPASQASATAARGLDY